MASSDAAPLDPVESLEPTPPASKALHHPTALLLLALVMPAAAVLRAQCQWITLARPAQLVLLGCVGVCACEQWAKPDTMALSLLVLVATTACLSSGLPWPRPPPASAALAEESSAPATHEIGIQCRLVGGATDEAAGIDDDALAEEEPARREAAAALAAAWPLQAEAEAEAEAVHELRVLLESDGVLLPPRLDDAELLRFLQATRPPLQARAAVEAVADDIRWRATRGGGAGTAPAAEPDAARAGAPLVGSALGLCGADLAGRPCLLLRVRRVLAAAPGAPPEGEVARVHALQAALVALLDAQCDRGGPQALAILLDLRGVELVRASPCLAAARDLVGLLRAHYPQRAGAIHVVELLPVMRWLLAAACALLDSRTAKKVVVHAELASLRQHFAPAQLLHEHGGEAAALGDMHAEGEEAPSPGL